MRRHDQAPRALRRRAAPVREHARSVPAVCNTEVEEGDWVPRCVTEDEANDVPRQHSHPSAPPWTGRVRARSRSDASRSRLRLTVATCRLPRNPVLEDSFCPRLTR